MADTTNEITNEITKATPIDTLAGNALAGNVLPAATKLIGKVTVQPATVVPGQPVLVQVLDPTGKPITDSNITVIIGGAPAASRYCQFAAPGSHNLFVSVSRGSQTETAQATVTVAGTALAFRQSLTKPAVTEIPMLQARGLLGSPYSATFTLGNTPGTRRLAAIAKAALAPTPVSKTPAGTAPPPVIAKSVGTATSTILNAGSTAARPADEATSYRWDFGDGQTLTTKIPTVTHDYFPAILAGDVVRSFDVTCTVVHDNVTVKRTISLHSAYGLCKRSGVVVPPVTGTGDATFQHVAFSASLIVHNLEDSAITLNGAAYVPFSDTTTVVLPAPKFTTLKTPVVVAAKSASALGVYVTLDQLMLTGAVVNGFTVYYSGAMKDGDKSVPVRFSYAFRIPLNDSGMVEADLSASQLKAANWDLDAALKAISAAATATQSAVSKAGGQVLDTATNTVAIALSADASDINTLAHVRSAIQAGLTSIALKSGALTDKGVALRLLRPKTTPATTPAPVPASGSTPAPRDRKRINPLAPLPVAVGNPCFPDDISDADMATAAAQQLVCQLTTDTIPATIPAQFQNAQQGDIILSPAPVGTGDLIAALFSALTPPQHHGHSGMMTANYFEITHSTSSPDRVSANLNTDAVGIPTNLNPNTLQYGWPGSITQSIDDATGSVYLEDPGGAGYQFYQSFSTGSVGDGTQIIPPLVVKPLPENEDAVRPALRKAADTARSKGAQYQPGGTKTQPGKLLQAGGCYYSFYIYTDAQLSEGFTDVAGADAGWAQGLSPSVCSSFCWMSLKENNIPLVTKNQFEKLSDFSQTAIDDGAQVGPATVDGLCFYPEAERAQGGQALYQLFMEQALSKEDGFGTLFGGAVNNDIAGPIANQLLNTFASGNPNLQTTAWQTPGDGNAVSPDNIRLWNPPYYGYAEPLQYLPQHDEQYTVSQWNKVIGWGTVKGTVRYNGAGVANVHVWVFDNPGGDAYTAADGSYTLNQIPIGNYALTAQGVVTVDGVQGELTNGFGGQPISLTKTKPDVVQDIDLQGLPASFRRADISYSLTADHSDRNGGQTVGVLSGGPYSNSVDVNPGNTVNTYNYHYDYDGGGYYNVAFAWQVALLTDNSLQVTFTADMNSDNTSTDNVTITPYTFNVPVGQTVSTGYQDLYYSFSNLDKAYTNGPVNINFSVANNQQTG